MRAFCTWPSEHMTCGCTLQSPAKQEQGHSAEAKARAAEASSLCALAAIELGSTQELSRDRPPANSPSASAAPCSRSRASAEELPHCTQAMGHSSPAVDAGRNAVPPRCNDTAAELELSPESGPDVHEWPRRAPSAGMVNAQQSASIAPPADVMLAKGCCEPAADDGPSVEGRQHAMPADTEAAAEVAHWGQSPSMRGRELPAPARPPQLTVEPSDDCASAFRFCYMCGVLKPGKFAPWNVTALSCLANADPGAGAGTAIGDLFSSFTAFACLGQHSGEAQSQDGAGHASTEPGTGTMSALGSSSKQTPSWHAFAVAFLRRPSARGTAAWRVRMRTGRLRLDGHMQTLRSALPCQLRSGARAHRCASRPKSSHSGLSPSGAAH